MNNKNMPKDSRELSASDTAENNSSHEQVDSNSRDNAERPKHDELFKKVMSEPVAARAFLEHYLPVTFKNKINLNSVKIEKESFVTEDLRKRLSDVVYPVSLKNDNIKDSTAEKKVSIMTKRTYTCL